MKTQKEQAIEKLAELEAKADELRAIIDAPDNPTYDDVVNKLQPIYGLSPSGVVFRHDLVQPALYYSEDAAYCDALRRMWLNIIEFVNEGWECEDKYNYIYCDNGKIKHVRVNSDCEYGFTKFKSEEAAREALRIMGEEGWKRMHGIKE